MATFNSALWNSFLFGGGGGAPGPPPTPGSGTTVFDLIYQAYRIAGVLNAPGRNYSPEEYADGLSVLNAMIDEWNTEQIMIPSIRKDGYPLIANQQLYQIGPGATAPDFNGTRPNRIDYAGYVISAGTDAPLELQLQILSVGEWVKLQKKNFTDTLVRKLYYENSVPFGKVNLWPTPAAAGSLNLYTWQQLSQYTLGSTTVIVPQGFLRALEYNLAVELAVREPRNKMNPLAVEIAKESKAQIMAFNKLHYPELQDMLRS